MQMIESVEVCIHVQLFIVFYRSSKEKHKETIFDDIEDLEEQLSNATEEKVIVDVSALVKLFTKRQQDKCLKKIKKVEPKFVSSCVNQN